MVTMLKNKCSLWKRIKFPTFWYNCYYFICSDTYFIQLETLLINHPSYFPCICFSVQCAVFVYLHCVCYVFLFYAGFIIFFPDVETSRCKYLKLLLLLLLILLLLLLLFLVICYCFLFAVFSYFIVSVLCLFSCTGSIIIFCYWERKLINACWIELLLVLYHDRLLYTG